MAYLQKRAIILATVSLFLILLSFFVIIKPSILGYNIYSQDLSKSLNEAQELQSKILLLQTNLSICQVLSFQIESQKDLLSNQLDDCKLNFESFSKDIESLKEELDEKDNELNKLQLEFTSLVESLSKSICCKERVDNPRIDSYLLDNSKILCTQGGSLKLSC